jgi:hypothetical protein
VWEIGGREGGGEMGEGGNDGIYSGLMWPNGRLLA